MASGTAVAKLFILPRNPRTPEQKLSAHQHLDLLNDLFASRLLFATNIIL